VARQRCPPHLLLVLHVLPEVGAPHVLHQDLHEVPGAGAAGARGSFPAGAQRSRTPRGDARGPAGAPPRGDGGGGDGGVVMYTLALSFTCRRRKGQGKAGGGAQRRVAFSLSVVMYT